MKQAILFSFVSLLILTACGPRTESEVYEAAVGAQRMENFDEAISLFEQLLEDYPKSEKVPDAYYALGVLYQDRRKDFARAIEMYTKLYETYPDNPTSSNALFMVAFLQHNELKNLDGAKATYEMFLERYPDNPLAESAKFELANLGKEPADMLSNISN